MFMHVARFSGFFAQSLGLQLPAAKRNDVVVLEQQRRQIVSYSFIDSCPGNQKLRDEQDFCATYRCSLVQFL